MRTIFILLTAAICTVIAFLLLNNTEEQTPQTSEVREIADKDSAEPNFYKRVLNTFSNDEQSTETTITTTTEQTKIESNEDLVANDVDKNIKQWSQTKDPALLKKSIELTGIPDNEAVLESWSELIETSSADLISLTDGSPENRAYVKSVSLLFDWYIEFSGRFSLLTQEKQQEISRQSQQLKVFLR